MTESTSSAPAEEFSAESLLDQWLSACEANPWDALTRQAARSYSVIWRAWIKHITPARWQQASAMQALEFINSIEGMHHGQPSDVSRRRYWRVLDRIYEFAVLHGLCQRNPAQEIADQDRPPKEVHIATILSPRMWAALPCTLPPDKGYKHARTRAIVSLLIDTACTPGELAQMTMPDLVHDANGFITDIHIQGSRPHECRTLPVTSTTAMLITEWLSERHNYGPKAAASPYLFISRNGKLTHLKLHTIISAQLRYTALVSQLPVPPRTGAQIIRNTALVHLLLSGMDMHDVVAFAGIKNVSNMSHLRVHLPAHLHQSIASAPA